MVHSFVPPDGSLLARLLQRQRRLRPDQFLCGLRGDGKPFPRTWLYLRSSVEGDELRYGRRRLRLRLAGPPSDATARDGDISWPIVDDTGRRGELAVSVRDAYRITDSALTQDRTA